MAMTPAADPGQRRDPGDKAALERLGIQGGEDVAKMVVGGVPAGTGENDAADRASSVAEPGDLGEASPPPPEPPAGTEAAPPPADSFTLPLWRGPADLEMLKKTIVSSSAPPRPPN